MTLAVRPEHARFDAAMRRSVIAHTEASLEPGVGRTKARLSVPASYPPSTPSASAHVTCHSDSDPARPIGRLSHDVSSAPTSAASRQSGS